MTGAISQAVHRNIKVFAGRVGCEVVELNVLSDHVHLIVKVPPKLSISKVMGTLKGRSAIKMFQRFPQLRRKPYWGNHFWAVGYCVDSVGLDAEMIRKYVVYQEHQEHKQEQLGLF